jgi:hypothetical protein
VILDALFRSSGASRLSSKVAISLRIGPPRAFAAMYGPPPDAREKLRMKKVCVNVSGLFVEMILLAMMRYAAYLSLETPQPCQGHFGKQVSGTPF